MGASQARPPVVGAEQLALVFGGGACPCFWVAPRFHAAIDCPASRALATEGLPEKKTSLSNSPPRHSFSSGVALWLVYVLPASKEKNLFRGRTLRVRRWRARPTHAYGCRTQASDARSGRRGRDRIRADAHRTGDPAAQGPRLSE